MGSGVRYFFFPRSAKERHYSKSIVSMKIGSGVHLSERYILLCAGETEPNE